MRTKKTPRTKVFNFYPGSFWFKRATFIALMFTIGFNFFLDKVQADLFKKGEEFVAEARQISRTLGDYADKSDTLFSVFSGSTPIIKDTSKVDLTIQLIEREVQERLSAPNFQLPTSGKIQNDRKNITDFKETISTYDPLFRSASRVIQLTSVFIWFSVIAVSAPWLFLHMIYGTKYDRQYTFNWLIGAAIFNPLSYIILVSVYESDEEGILNFTKGIISQIFDSIG